MAKGRLSLLQTDDRWLVDCRFKFDPQLLEVVKHVPGARWDPDHKKWSFPKDMCTWLHHEAVALGYDKFYANWEAPWVPDVDPIHPDAWLTPSGYRPFEFQCKIAPDMAQHDEYVAYVEMGLGKTIMSFIAMRINKADTVLVVGPAVAQGVWAREIEEWWPGKAFHPIQRPNTQKWWQVVPGAVNFISHDLLPRAMKEGILEGVHLDEVYIDELHYYQNENTKRYVSMARILELNPKAKRRGLTGTPMSKDPSSMCTGLELMFPGRFQTRNKFRRRYMKGTVNDYGTAFKGANEKYAPELRNRLGIAGCRVTKADVADLLPPFLGPSVVPALDVVDDSGIGVKTIRHWAEDQLRTGATHLSIQCYRRATVVEVAHYLEPRVPVHHVFRIDGSMTPAARDAIIQGAKKVASSILVSTIDSTKVAIDLTYVNSVMYAEVTDDMAALVQSLGRYQRLSSTHPVSCYLLQLHRHDKQLIRIAHKLKAMGMVLRATAAESQLEDALAKIAKDAKLTKNEVLELARLAASSYTGSTSGSEDWNEKD